ncbi:5923_t:CDS:2, partial [Cetraspora pellucida]
LASNEQLTSNNNVQAKKQELDEVFDFNKPKLLFLIGDLKNLPTEIYLDYLTLKAILSAHTTAKNRKDMFGDKLKDLVKEENKHDYSSSEEEDKPDKTKMQGNNKEASDLC